MNEPDKQSKNQILTDVKGIGKWFQLDVSLKLFGQTVWEWHFPPKN